MSNFESHQLRSRIHPGQTVDIVLKKDQPTGKLPGGQWGVSSQIARTTGAASRLCLWMGRWAGYRQSSEKTLMNPMSCLAKIQQVYNLMQKCSIPR